ncbi:MAG: NAD(P)-dependent oxidoreductase [Bacillus sp. (in: Bacteria)]|nr:NAD(P)-dependent oxidoreductase [Bacillus sp. (in: firmicutes)]
MTEKKELVTLCKEVKPSAIIHTAAMTNVDGGEESYRRMTEVNIHGTNNVLEAGRFVQCPVLYLSSDFVFDGKKHTSYKIEDPPSPLNHYGFTKWVGEEYVRMYPFTWWIVRTSWLFGGGENNFVYKIAQKAVKEEEIAVVTDQIGSPTNVTDLASTLILLLQAKPGKYHLTNKGYCSRFELAKFIYGQFGKRESLVTPITSKDWKGNAVRPTAPRLAIGEDFQPKGPLSRSWQQAVTEYLQKLGWKHD